jgi:hypothetical protein
MLDVLRDLRDREQLTVEFLKALPIQPDRFPAESMFRPVFDAVLNGLRHEPLLPIEGGRYASAKATKLGRSKALRSLLTPPVLSALWPSGITHHWLDDAITADRTPALFRYAKEQLLIEEITPESTLPRITSTFLANQTDEWICRLYAVLQANQALWRGPRWDGDRAVGPARTMPIIRLEDGRHVAPFDAHGQEAVWLPGPVQSGFPTVKASLVQNSAAREFLVGLGLTPPDLSDDVIRHVIPRYLAGNRIDDSTHQADLERIFRALDEVRGPDRRKLIEFLKKTPFLHATDVTGTTYSAGFCSPASLYEPTPELKQFLVGNPDALFVHPSYHPHLVALRELGMTTTVRLRRKPADANGYVQILRDKGNHKRGLANFDPDTVIEHLTFALEHPTPERSAYVWNHLLETSLIKGIVEHSSRVDYSNASRKEVISPVGEIASTRRWLPGTDDAWHRPDEISIKDLPTSYHRKEDLARALGMVMPEVDQASRQLGVDRDLLLFVQQNPDQVRALLERQAARRPILHADADGADDDDDEHLDFREDLGRRFARPTGRPPADDVAISNGRVTNPELRRQRTADEIATQRASEPPRNQRFRRVSAKVWDGRGSEVRAFLQAQYGGNCQICSAGFAKRNGDPYFEGLYLVPRRKAAWIDRPGNVLALCATCTAKFEHGAVEADDILQQVERWYPGASDGRPSLTVTLCDEPVQIHFSEKHLLDLQEMLTAALAPPKPEEPPVGTGPGPADELMAALEASLEVQRNRPTLPCPSCGLNNRLPVGYDNATLRCGKCKTEMPTQPGPDTVGASA